MAPSWPVHAFMGKWLIFPAKQLNFSEAKNCTVFFWGSQCFLKTHTAGGAQELCMTVNISCYRCFPNGPQHPEHSPDKVRKEQRCWMADDENEAERSRASRSVMVTGPGINLDLLTPYFVISPLDVFLFSFENVDSLLERKIYKHYTFHCQKKGFVIWYRNSFNYCGNFTAWGRKGQIC